MNGIQAHIAYPHLGRDPIHDLTPALAELAATVWDRLDYVLEWTGSGRPFLTPRGRLVDATSEAIRTVTGVTPEITCTGGTSDGRFLATICDQVVEFGPVNATIHKLNEHVAVADLEPLARIYENLLGQLLSGAPVSS